MTDFKYFGVLRALPNLSRCTAKLQIDAAPDGCVIEIKPATRSLEASAKFHSICGDLAKSGKTWAGSTRTLVQWKVLLVSGHAIATGLGAEIIPGLENEFINIRESTAQMGVKRLSSLIEYSLAWCALNNIVINDC